MEFALLIWFLKLLSFDGDGLQLLLVRAQATTRGTNFGNHRSFEAKTAGWH
jgi:hypothetical protein